MFATRPLHLGVSPSGQDCRPRSLLLGATRLRAYGRGTGTNDRLFGSIYRTKYAGPVSSCLNLEQPCVFVQVRVMMWGPLQLASRCSLEGFYTLSDAFFAACLIYFSSVHNDHYLREVR